MISLTYPMRLLLAILGHLSLYIIGTNIAWALRKPKPGRFGQVIEFVRLWGRKLWLGEALRLAYYLIPPYLVLYYGWASPLDLGLADLDWIRGIGWSVALGSGSLLLLALLWWQYTRLIREQPRMQGIQWLTQPWGGAFVLREVILMESWWSLCRSPMLLLAGSYWGVYLGLAAVFVAAMLNAHMWYALSTPGLREEVVLTGSLAMVTATLYAFIHNLWLCIAVHFVLRMAILHLLRAGRAPHDFTGEQFGA
nr:hypothetical protein [Chloroflexota bacterium]